MVAFGIVVAVGVHVMVAAAAGASVMVRVGVWVLVSLFIAVEGRALVAVMLGVIVAESRFGNRPCVALSFQAF
jgi:hypothetical protein